MEIPFTGNLKKIQNAAKFSHQNVMLECLVLFCQPRVEVTSCLFTKLWDLPFMTGLIHS